MTSIGVPAVAGDTGGAALPAQKATSATAREVPRAPGTQRPRALTGAQPKGQSKPGRSLLALTDLAPATRAPWFAPFGPSGPCRKCRAQLVALLPGAARIRVLHERGCTR